MFCDLKAVGDGDNICHYQFIKKREYVGNIVAIIVLA